jgi:alanyl-tRNA synthetase
VRRIEAVAGLRSFETAFRESERLRALAAKLNSPMADVEKKLDAVLSRFKELEKALKAASQRESADRARELAAAAELINGIPTIIANVGQIDGDALQAIVDALRSRFQGVVVLAASEGGAVSLAAAVSPDFTSRVQAGKLIQQVAATVGGKGGGRPDNARGGGREPAKIDDALAQARALISKKREG